MICFVQEIRSEPNILEFKIEKNRYDILFGCILGDIFFDSRLNSNMVEACGPNRSIGFIRRLKTVF